MAKKAKTAAAKTPPPTRKERAQVENILDDMKKHVLKGMSPKTFEGPAVEQALRTTMRPKVLRRLREGGVWAKEKKNALTVARHMGKIAKLLAKRPTVDLSIADAARVAVKNDEHCPRSGTARGDWCF